jgi:hypothetical protein
MSMFVRDEDFEVLSGETVRYADRKHLDGQQGCLGELFIFVSGDSRLRSF